MATLPSPADILWQEEHVSDDKAPDIIAVNVICFSIACSAVFARFTARRIKNIAYGADDWLILAGLVRPHTNLFRRLLVSPIRDVHGFRSKTRFC